MEVDGIGLNVLSTIKEMQNTHGLRSADYQRYRQFCTRKIRRLCKVLNFLHGNGKKFEKREIDLKEVTDSRYVLMLLLHSERAWSYAEQLKEDNSEGNLRKQRHYVAKLRKAALCSAQLNELANSKCTPDTQKQSSAYHLGMTGLLGVAKQEWAEALDAYTKARDIWANILSDSSSASANYRDLITERIAEIEQSRRLCWYKAGKDMAKFEAIAGDSASSRPDKDFNIVWRGSPIQIHSEKLRDLVSDTETKLTAIETEKAKQMEGGSGTTAQNNAIDMYDKLFLIYQDAITLTKNDLKAESADSSQLHRSLNYFTCKLQQQTVAKSTFLIDAYTQRHLAKVEKPGSKRSVGPSDICRLFDILVVNLNDLLAIPGIEDDDDLNARHHSELLVARASRMYWKGLAFGDAAKYVEGLACFHEAEQLVSEAFTYQAQQGLDNTDVKALSDKVRSKKCMLSATAFLDKHKSQEEVTSATARISLAGKKRTRTLYQCGDEWTVDCTSLIDIPFGFQSIPCKPIFYDIAANFVVEADISEKAGKKQKQAAPAQPKAAAAQPEEKKGGWLGGWF